MNSDNLTAKGLKYIDDDGVEKLIPRANLQDGYKYTVEDTEKKEYLMMLCIQKYPDLDKVTIELFVDRWLNHKDEMIKEMTDDEEYMSKFK
jgi:hypothetical protein